MFKIKEIQIAVAFDENYAYPAIVMLTSLFENALDNTKYIVTAMIPSNLSDETKSKVISLNELYQSHEIIFYDMGDAFINAPCDLRFSTATYYRLKLPDVLKDQDKCIYIDVDTIVLKDLQELHDIDIENYYIAGTRDVAPFTNYENIKERMIKIGNVDTDNYVGSGLLLFNLKKMRQDDIYKKFKNLISTKAKLLVYYDMDTLNAICYGKILLIDLKFHVFNYFHHYDCARNIYYSDKDLEEAKQNPHIIHYVGFKPWQNRNVPLSDFWFNYAKKSKFYYEICKKFDLRIEE
ncbi:MAG: glycosyltransferase family 8 protein [Clostridiales bacterium]|nr:glycosyltransferase family 8 protein [Clostridiales bacterium]